MIPLFFIFFPFLNLCSQNVQIGSARKKEVMDKNGLSHLAGDFLNRIPTSKLEIDIACKINFDYAIGITRLRPKRLAS